MAFTFFTSMVTVQGAQMGLCIVASIHDCSYVCVFCEVFWGGREVPCAYLWWWVKRSLNFIYILVCTVSACLCVFMLLLRIWCLLWKVCSCRYVYMSLADAEERRYMYIKVVVIVIIIFKSLSGRCVRLTHHSPSVCVHEKCVAERLAKVKYFFFTNMFLQI